jgi:hypothetical protein
MRVSGFAIVVLIIASVGTSLGQEAFTMKYKFARGKTYRYADTVMTNMTQEMMGQEMKMTNGVHAIMRIVGEEAAADGGSVLLVSADTIRVSVKNPRMDSTLVPMELAHKRTRVTLDARGDVKKRVTVDSVQAPGMMGMGSGTIQQLLRFPILPEKAVKAGEKWTGMRSDTSDAMGGKSVSNTTYEYTLVGKGRYSGQDCLKISYSGKMTITSKGTMGGMDVFTEGNGTMTGTVYFDPKAGLMVAEEGKMDVELTAAVTGAQNMTIPITQSATQKHVLLPE